MKNIYIISSVLLIMLFTNNISASPVKDEISCMAKTIYWEARGEPYKGKLGIAAVIVNRLNHDKFPNTICEVVHQTKPLQFSKHVTRNTRIVDDFDVWLDCLILAGKIIRKEIIIPPQFKALYFDKKSVKVNKKLHMIIGNHKFYI